MSAAQTAPGDKFIDFGLRIIHGLVLQYMRSRSAIMPIYEYICKECDHEFEAIVYGSQKAACPKCQSKQLAPQLSVFAVSAKGSSTPRASAGPCGSCGDPRGPGSCRPPTNIS